MKPLIVWDFDDVLFPLTEAWFTVCGPKIQSRITHFHQITENPPHLIMGISLEYYHESLDNFRNSEEAQLIQLNPNISDWLRINGAAYQHFILTARPLNTIKAAQCWLGNNFSEPLAGFGFVPAGRTGQELSGYYRSKQDYLMGEGMLPNYFIDDNATTINAVAKGSHGAVTILFPAPWNRAWSDKENIQALLPGGLK